MCPEKNFSSNFHYLFCIKNKKINKKTKKTENSSRFIGEII